MVKICKSFFLSTLGYHPKNDAAVIAVMKATQIADVQPATDRRGKHPPANKIEESTIQQHVETYHPQISHYRREHAPLRRYLPSDVTMVSMHADFNEKNPSVKCGYQTYRKIVHKLNISFTKLGEEQCEACVMHNISQHSEGCTCNDCQIWKCHVTRAQEAREMYRADATAQWSSDYSVRSVDLQKVIMLPRMPGVKSSVFTRRIIAFHETFATVGNKKENKAKKKTISVVWHEGTAGRKAEEITAAFLKALKFERDQKHVIYWLDNCSAQNKNWCLYTTLVSVINSHEIEAEDITLKYFESGHTFMSADSFHHGVEQEMKAQPNGNVYDFDDFCRVIQQSNNGKVHVLVMENQDFLHHVSQCATTRGKSRPLLSSIVEVRFSRGSRNILYKTSYTGSYQTLDFLKKKFHPAMPNRLLRAEPRGIPSGKKDDIISKLCPLMPASRRVFWQDLNEDDVPDLGVDFE